jgi:FdhD protein
VPPRPGVVRRPLRRVRPAPAVPGAPAPVAALPEEGDSVAVEEPLEVRVAGDTVAVTMRTPGADRQLAVGFLFSEGLLEGVEDVGTLVHCGVPGSEGYGHVLEVTPAAGAALPLERLEASRRGTLTTSACGVCGRQQVDDLLARFRPLPVRPTLPAALLARLPELLAPLQPTFALTGGVHGAAAVDAGGEVLASAEDVGRHNAVDKVVGALVLAGVVRARDLPGRPAPARPPAALVVSSRASFDIVQKALVARIPVVASVGAASSLAVDLAARGGVTLAAFVRGGRMSVFTHPERLT